jgi:carboxylate-amine ligase
VGDPPDGMLAEFEALLDAQVSPEFLRSQIEIGTRVCATLEEARAELRRLRSGIAAVAARHGMAPIAAATHPFARWEAQAARTEALAAVVDWLITETARGV